MAKLPRLDHVKYVRTKGRVYAYFNTGRKTNGKPIYARLPDPSDVGFAWNPGNARFCAVSAGKPPATYSIAWPASGKPIQQEQV